jgi:hypothetical protein
LGGVFFGDLPPARRLAKVRLHQLFGEIWRSLDLAGQKEPIEELLCLSTNRFVLADEARIQIPQFRQIKKNVEPFPGRGFQAGPRIMSVSVHSRTPVSCGFSLMIMVLAYA